MSKTNSKSNKNSRILFSVICVCIIALGVIVYFASQQSAKLVGEQTTVEDTTSVDQRVSDVTEKETTTSVSTTKKATTTEKTTMEKGDSNTPYISFYKYPLSDKTVKTYSEELVYDETMEDYRAHTAVDFAGKAGDEVVCINDGLVLSVEDSALYGKVVKIDHGANLVAVYSGLDKVLVKKGQTVAIGQKIGSLGTIPCESAEKPHLHLETLLNKKYVDPLVVMSKKLDDSKTVNKEKTTVAKETTKKQ